jgi:hypothetical protein
MASGPAPPNPAELLAGPKMLSLLTIAAQKFDLVIVDGPPVSGLADAPLLASMAVGLVTHKALWPFLFILAVVGAWQRRMPLWLPALAAVPLVVYWLIGASFHHGLDWLVRTNIAVELTSHSQLPIFDGLEQAKVGKQDR